MTESVLAIQFGPLDQEQCGDWTIKLNSFVQADGSAVGEFSGQPPGERYTWEWNAKTKTVFVSPHPSGTVTNFRWGLPDKSLREPLMKLIEKQTKTADH